MKVEDNQGPLRDDKGFHVLVHLEQVAFKGENKVDKLYFGETTDAAASGTLSFFHPLFSRENFL